LTSLKPRLHSKSWSAILPSAAVIRALHKTLPAQATEGWYGTLAEGRKTALRDDSTVYLPVAPASSTVAVTKSVAPPPALPSSTQTLPQSQYARQPNYQYSSYPQQYQAYLPYGNQPQSSGYYPQQGFSNAAGSAQQQPAATPPISMQQHSQYSWQHSIASQASGITSGRGTPQPQAGGMPSPYSTYNTQINSATLPRVVTNTVMPTGKQQNGWSSIGSGYPLLPQHMRTTAVSPSPLAGYNHAYGTPPVH